jgi:hypothetical protein
MLAQSPGGNHTLKKDEQDTMTPSTDATTRARFDSALSLWIAIWQRQLVYGQAGLSSSLES